MLLFFLIGTFLLALNVVEELGTMMDLKFSNVDPDANVELCLLFAKVLVSSYLLEITLRSLKLRKF